MFDVEILKANQRKHIETASLIGYFSELHDFAPTSFDSFIEECFSSFANIETARVKLWSMDGPIGLSPTGFPVVSRPQNFICRPNLEELKEDYANTLVKTIAEDMMRLPMPTEGYPIYCFGMWIPIYCLSFSNSGRMCIMNHFSKKLSNSNDVPVVA